MSGRRGGFTRWAAACASAVLASVSGSASAAESPLAPLKPFLKSHCVACHDKDTKEGGLDLTSGDELSDPRLLSVWVRVHDRVAAGEMPPKDEKRPPAASSKTFLKTLSTELTRADAARAQTVLRRLNKLEYETTLRDLLGVETELQSLLPEDGKAHGFDNVGEALDLSPVHLQRYMEAAGKALDAAACNGPAIERTNPSYAFDTGGNAKFVGKEWLKRPDGAVVFYGSGGYPSIKADHRTAIEGRYRVRVTGYAYQSETPVRFAIYLGPEYQTGSKLFGHFELPPGEPTTIEFEAPLRKGDIIRFYPRRIPNPYGEIKKAGVEAYKGPGLALVKLEVDGPLEPWPGRGHKLRFGEIVSEDTGPVAQRTAKWYKPQYKIRSAKPEEDIAKLLPKFVEAAFRRPVAPAETARYVDLALAEMKSGAAWDDALRTAQIAVLCSPDFLYLVEPAGKLSDYALASRLSYMLWGTLPDAELLAAAAAGKLSKPEGLRAQTERLLADGRSHRFTSAFTGQWLNLRDVEFTTPDKQLYPEYDELLQDALVPETERFFEEILKHNRSLLEFIHSDWTMLNQPLAEHYGIPGVEGLVFRKVALKSEHHRGGVLTHAGVLKVSANGTATSPVVRGAYVLERILGIHPPPPPPGIPGVEPDIRGASTLREMLAKHRDNESCNACHKIIDPAGFALENYDVAGGWRENYRSLGKTFKSPPLTLTGGKRVSWKLGPPVDATGETAAGKPFKNLDDYKKLLLADPAAFARALAEKLAVYGTGRGMGFSDRPEIERIATAVAAKKYGFRDLLHEVVQSKIFRTK